MNNRMRIWVCDAMVGDTIISKTRYLVALTFAEQREWTDDTTPTAADHAMASRFGVVRVGPTTHMHGADGRGVIWTETLVTITADADAMRLYRGACAAIA